MKINNRIKFFFGILFFFFMALNVNSSALAIEDEVVSRVLGGLKAVFLDVAPVSPVIKEKGLTSEKLKADIEQKLQDAGINVIPEQEYQRLKRTPRYPLCRLELFVHAVEIQDKGVMNFYIVLQVQQAAYLSRNYTIKISAPTWEKGELSYSYGSSVDSIPKVVRTLTDKFIKAFLEANKENK